MDLILLMREINFWILVSGLIPLVIFIALFRQTNYQENPLGRIVMVKKVDLAIIFLYLILVRFFGPENIPWREFVAFPLFVILVTTFWLDTKELKRGRKQGKEDREK